MRVIERQAAGRHGGVDRLLAPLRIEAQRHRPCGRLALRARRVAGRDRSRVYAAIRRRLWRRPFGFVLPLRSGAALPSTAAQ